jgi:hypothetical protein
MRGSNFQNLLKDQAAFALQNNGLWQFQQLFWGKKKIIPSLLSQACSRTHVFIGNLNSSQYSLLL